MSVGDATVDVARPTPNAIVVPSGTQRENGGNHILKRLWRWELPIGLQYVGYDRSVDSVRSGVTGKREVTGEAAGDQTDFCRSWATPTVVRCDE